MNIPSNEIIKHPYTYMENIILKKDMNNETLESVMYNYVPFLLKENDMENLNNSVSYDKNSEVKFLFDISKIYKFFNSDKEFQISNSKKFILDILRNLPSNNEVSEYASKIKNICNNILDNIKKYQYDNKLLESALVNFSPIVPYSGVIKQPNMSESAMSNLDIDVRNNIDSILYILNKPNEEIKGFIKNTLVNNPFDIIANSHKFINNNNYNREYNIKEDNEDNSLLSSDIISLLSSKSFDISELYFIITYIYYSFKREQYPDIINKLKQLKNSMSEDIDTFKNTSVQTAMETMNYFNLPSINDSILDIDVTENMEYENDRKISKLMDMSDLEYKDFQTKNYNLDKLLAFLYNSRRYKTNTYTNNLFLNDNEIIEGFSYIQNGEDEILVCEIDNKTLTIPVMDLADNYKMKLISMDKNNSIEITTSFKTKKD